MERRKEGRVKRRKGGKKERKKLGESVGRLKRRKGEGAGRRVLGDFLECWGLDGADEEAIGSLPEEWR